MKLPRYAVFGIAGLAAIVLALLVRGMIAGGKPAQPAQATVAPPAPVATARVLIASHDIKAGTHLTDADLTWQDWPVNSLNPSYIVNGAVPGATPAGTEDAAAKTKPGAVANAAKGVAQTVSEAVSPGAKEKYIGGVAREDILANEPIIDSKIVRADEGGFMAVMLRPGMRALAVPVSVDNTAGGFILPGDRVDILATHQIPRQGGQGTVDSVQPVLRNIRVLAIDQQVQADENKQSVIGATATLEVSPEDGQVVTLAKASGTLSLMLRSYADAAGPSGAVVSSSTGNSDMTVRVYRPNQTSEVLVSR